MVDGTGLSLTIFETALGFFAAAWSGRGLARLALPEPAADIARKRIAGWSVSHRLSEIDPDEAPAFVRDAIGLIGRYARGEAVDLFAIPLDMQGPVEPFERAIYKAASKLQFGEVVTYGELADRAGFPGKARETGQALGRNPIPLVVPCHRIVAAGGRIGGFSAPGGSVTKQRLLSHEGVALGPPPPAQAAFPF